MYTEPAVSIIEDANLVSPNWHVLWTHSNCERTVYEQLAIQGYEVFLPAIGRWSRRGDLRYVAHVPMFPGYLFLRYPIDKSSYIQICKTKGLARILGQCWDRLATVPAREIEAIQKLIKSDLMAKPYPFMREGQRVRVVHGPLANVEGVLVKSEPEKGILVLSVEMLQRSVGIEIDCTAVELV